MPNGMEPRGPRGAYTPPPPKPPPRGTVAPRGPRGAYTPAPPQELTWEERKAKAEEATVRARMATEEARPYLEGLREILEEYVAKGSIYPEKMLEVWEFATQYIAESGLTPALPFYKEVQWRGIEREAQGQYERFKDAILVTDWSYSEKFASLLRAHPRAGDVKVFRQIKSDLWASLSPEEQAGRVREVESAEERARKVREVRYAPRYAPSYAYPEPMRYEPAFEEERAGLGGTRPWKSWFENRYGTLVRRFKAITEEPTEKGWAEYLKAQKPKLREEWAGLGAWGRGERPSAFAPRVRTVRW